MALRPTDSRTNNALWGNCYFQSNHIASVERFVARAKNVTELPVLGRRNSFQLFDTNIHAKYQRRNPSRTIWN